MVSDRNAPPVTVESVPFADIRHCIARAARDHVSLSDTRNTDWFVVREDGAIVGIAGLMAVQSGYRLKGAWVDPAYRGRGIGLALTEKRIQLAEQRCGSFIETLSLHPAFFEARGFRANRVMSNGAVRMRRVL
jgi:N-acetylglutamate synthase-like GNAT family acetyltransferase